MWKGDRFGAEVEKTGTIRVERLPVGARGRKYGYYSCGKVTVWGTCLKKRELLVKKVTGWGSSSKKRELILRKGYRFGPMFEKTGTIRVER